MEHKICSILVAAGIGEQGLHPNMGDSSNSSSSSSGSSLPSTSSSSSSSSDEELPLFDENVMAERKNKKTQPKKRAAKPKATKKTATKVDDLHLQMQEEHEELLVPGLPAC